MQRVSHSLKDAAASIGAGGLSELCARVETLSRSGLAADVRALVAPLAGELDRVREALTVAVEAR